MKFAKPSVSIADQIALLRGRGMIIADTGKAEHYLRHASYYRLRAYWLTFEQADPPEGQHLFKEGTTLDQVLDLYIFDRKLRLLVMDAIERIEVSLRGGWAHHLAMQYGPHGYLDAALYARADYHEKALTSLVDELDRSKDTFIVHYREKYGDPEQPPVWMTAEVISLGQLSKWMGNLNARSDRQAIARAYRLDERVLVSVAHHLTYVRNICAHHGRLWNKRFTVAMILPKNPPDLSIAFNTAAERNLYNTLVMLGYLLGVIAPGTNWRTELRELVASCQHADLAAIGFPPNWTNLAFWQV